MIIQGFDVRKTGCVPETENVPISILVGLLRFLEKSRPADSYLSLQMLRRFETSYAIIGNCASYSYNRLYGKGAGDLYVNKVLT